MSLFFGFTGFGSINPSGYLRPGYLGGGGGSGMAIFIRNALRTGWIVAGLAAFVYMIMGGFKYITAGGDQKSTQEAAKQITGAVIGLVIIVASYALTRIISVVFGIDIFSPEFKGP